MMEVTRPFGVLFFFLQRGDTGRSSSDFLAHRAYIDLQKWSDYACCFTNFRPFLAAYLSFVALLSSFALQSDIYV